MLWRLLTPRELSFGIYKYFHVLTGAGHKMYDAVQATYCVVRRCSYKDYPQLRPRKLCTDP